MTIAIVDRYPILRSGLRIFIKDHFSDATFIDSESIGDFRIKNPHETPAVIIMALSQNASVHNLEVIRLTKMWYDLRTVIFYDEHAYSSMISQYFREGAYHYLSKTSSMNELVYCISHVLEGRSYVTRDALLWNNDCFRSGNQDKVFELLTTNELEVARYLSEGKRISWIAEALGKRGSAVSSMKAKIFKKLSVNNVIELCNIIK